MEGRLVKLPTVGAIVLIGLLGIALLVLRYTGLEPADVPGSVVVEHGLNYFVRPGLWQQGELVRTPVEDWSFVRKARSVALETRSPYFIPHSVRVGAIPKGKFLYITSAQYQMDKGYPDRLWTSNVFRDPRVRLKIGDKLYEMTMVLVTDRAEAEEVFGRNPEYWSDEGGQERLLGYQHIYRAFQRNVAEYGQPKSPRDYSGLPGGRLPDGRLSSRAAAALASKGTLPPVVPANAEPAPKSQP